MAQVLKDTPAQAATLEQADTETWDSRVAAACARTLLQIEVVEPGATLLYHEGHLAFDMAKDPDVAGIAAAFHMAAVDRGQGFLVQKRISEEECQYLFCRARLPL